MRQRLAALALVVLAWASAVWLSAAPYFGRPPKPVAPAAVVGDWSMEWAGLAGHCHLEPNGFWSCAWNGSVYAGSWCLKDGRLAVDEALVGPNDNPALAPGAIRWAGKLQRTAKGWQLARDDGSVLMKVWK